MRGEPSAQSNAAPGPFRPTWRGWSPAQLTSYGAALQSFERSPANLVRMDKDNFVLAVPGSDSVPEGVTPEQLQELEQDPHAGHQVMHPSLHSAGLLLARV